MENLPVPVRSIKSEKKIVNINLTFIKQTLKSRLTACQLILLLLNILGIITVVIIVVVVRKQSCSTQKASSDGKYIAINHPIIYLFSFRCFGHKSRNIFWRYSWWCSFR
jgi:hypothetical protein